MGLTSLSSNSLLHFVLVAIYLILQNHDFLILSHLLKLLADIFRYHYGLMGIFLMLWSFIGISPYVQIIQMWSVEIHREFLPGEIALDWVLPI